MLSKPTDGLSVHLKQFFLGWRVTSHDTNTLNRCHLFLRLASHHGAGLELLRVGVGQIRRRRAHPGWKAVPHPRNQGSGLSRQARVVPGEPSKKTRL